MRAHGHLYSQNREPYKQSTAVMELVKSSINLRYDLFPYLYTQFYLTASTGLPLMRPLWYEFPIDPKTNEIDTQYMLGPSLMVAPKLTKMLNKEFMKPAQYSVPTYFPGDAIWYPWGEKYQKITGNHSIDRILHESEHGLYVRGGSLLITQFNEEGKRLSIN